LTWNPASVETRVVRQAPRSEQPDETPLFMQVRPSPQDKPPAESADPPHNVSFVARGFTSIGDKVKKLNDTLGELQSLGIQHVTSLPEVVLVGDQSAGKSSLMSAFSGIYLPRSEGVCTRCPVHIRLSQKPSWSCKISLQQNYDYQPPAGRYFSAWPSGWR